MGRLIDADKLIDKAYDVSPAYGMTVIGVTEEDIEDAPTIEAIPKDQYEARLKADMVAILTDIQLEIKELWDSRYDVWIDNQYYIGKSDTLGEVDEVIQQKIDALKEQTDGKV